MIGLYIKNTEVDITEEVGLYLNKRFENLENPTKYYSDFSKTIKLPVTQKNKLLFDNYSRQDSVVTTGTLDPRKKTPFYLIYNGEKVMDGWLKINNSNTAIEDNVFEVELYSSFGLIMNEIGQLTFNKWETSSYGGVKDDQYLIESPFLERLNASLVKRSWEKDGHNMDGDDILDYIKFIPSYQGKYDDFESDKLLYNSNITIEMPNERDEHYMREFRSYYQQPAIWVEKLWKMVRDKVNEITGYEMVLDPSWFNNENPYWTDLIYTCPSLYEKDGDFKAKIDDYNPDSLNYEQNFYTQDVLSSHHRRRCWFYPEGGMCRDGVFNPDRLGSTRFTCNTSLMLYARNWTSSPSNKYAKIRKDNPLYVDFIAVNADTNQDIKRIRYMLYSETTTNWSQGTYDYKLNCGITNTEHPPITSGYPTGYPQGTYGYWFEAPVQVVMDIVDNVPYYIVMDAHFANNSKAIETAPSQGINLADWLWTDFFWTPSSQQLPNLHGGYVVFSNVQHANCETSDYRRSESWIDIHRVFPKKDVTILDVLLNYSKQFGLMWDVDSDNMKINVCTRNKYFTGYHIDDWSKKIDRQSEFKLEPVTFSKKYVTFNVEDGKGLRYESYKNKYGVGYGSKKIDTGWKFNTDSDDLFKGIKPSMISQKAQLSRKYNNDDPSKDGFVGYNFRVYPEEHYVENDDDGSNAGNWGSFYFENGHFRPSEKLSLISDYGGKVVISDDTREMVLNDCYCWARTYGDGDTWWLPVWIYGQELTDHIPDISTIDRSGGYSVHFESPREYFFRTSTSGVKYIYDMFWKKFIDERYSIQNKKLTCYVYLTPEEYKQINFKNFVKIENTLYHINKVIDYDFDTNSPTKVELVQVWDISAYTDGQYSFPCISATPSYVELEYGAETDVSVYSTEEWEVYSKPSWVEHYVEGTSLYLNPNSNPIYSRSGVVTLRTIGDVTLTATVTVYQRPNNTHLNLDSNSYTFASSGETVRVGIDSKPTTLSVFLKPSWIDVTIFAVNTPLIVNTEAVPYISNVSTQVVLNPIVTNNPTLHYNNFEAKITARENNSPIIRRGTVIFTNGTDNKSFNVTQLGRKIIFETTDITPMHIPLGSGGTLNMRSYVQTDPASVTITRGSVDVPATDVDNMNINFTPALDTTDHGDGTPEVCTGGQITILGMDGQTIVKNYNYGPVKNTWVVIIISVEGGHITVDGTDYTSTYYMSHEDKENIYVTAVPDAGWSFLKWSDGVATAGRTINVTEDIEIYPIFTGGGDSYLFDDGDVVEYDDGDEVGY